MKMIRSMVTVGLVFGLFSTQAMAQTPGQVSTLNGTPQAMWVTLYENMGTGMRRIVSASCVKPGENRSWTIKDRKIHRVRAEMTKTPDCKALPNNSHVTCDTHMEVGSNAAFKLMAKPGGCYWEVVKAPPPDVKKKP